MDPVEMPHGPEAGNYSGYTVISMSKLEILGKKKYVAGCFE